MQSRIINLTLLSLLTASSPALAAPAVAVSELAVEYAIPKSELKREQNKNADRFYRLQRPSESQASGRINA
jgi:hypothetical protein